VTTVVYTNGLAFFFSTGKSAFTGIFFSLSWLLGPIPDNKSSWGVFIVPPERIISRLALT